MKKVKVPAERIKIGEYSQSIEDYKSMARQLARYVNPVLTEWNKLNIGELTLQELEGAISNPSIKVVESLVRIRVAGSVPVEVGGLKLSIEKLREMVEIPTIVNLSKEWMQLYGAAKRAREAQSPVSFSALILVDGEVCICQDTLSEFIDSRSTFAETEAEKEVYLILQEMAEAGQYLKDKYSIAVFRDQFFEQTSDMPSREGGLHKGKIEVSVGQIKARLSRFGS